MSKLQKTLLTAFSTNFMLYYSSHVAHVNLRGDDFLQFHEFLGEIYSDSQKNIDDYAEFLRILECDMPNTLNEVLLNSDIVDLWGIGKLDFSDYEKIFSVLYNHIETQIDILKDLYVLAEKDGDYGLSGYVQERLMTHKKQCWKLKMILTKEKEDD